MGVTPVPPDAVADHDPSNEDTAAYRVKNIFHTLQGEGFFAGRPAVFVRLVGCNMWSGYDRDRERDAERTGADCPLWCDTDFTTEGSQSYRAGELADAMMAVEGQTRFCVFTGGEPMLQMNGPLIEVLHGAGFQVAVETNGTIRLGATFPDRPRLQPDWIVCSPKLPEEQLPLERFDELKLIVPDYHPQQYRNFAERARLHEIAGSEVPLLWLQPEDGPRLDQAKQLAVQLALDNPDWRVSVQTHKVLGIE